LKLTLKLKLTLNLKENLQLKPKPFARNKLTFK